MSVVPTIWVPYPQPASSVELRCGVLYSGCQCVKRNGLQQDCPRSACQGRASCMDQPAPTCVPSGNNPRPRPSLSIRAQSNGNAGTLDGSQVVGRGQSTKQRLDERLRDMTRRGYVDHILVRAWDNNHCKVHRTTEESQDGRRQSKRKE